jgi:hypothetical protein
MNKGHILQEIHRTAAANGGKPLGWRRFAAATGIREADWLGKFWARWGDALQEAGFARNRLQAAYSRDDLLEKYALFAEELGRLPTANDLRMKDRVEPGFPNQKVFERLGTKLDLVRLVREHCEGTGSHPTVIGLCDGYVPSGSSRISRQGAQTGEPGYVYLIKSGRFFKVGRSNSAGRREYEVALQLPEKANTVHVIKTDDPVGIEAYWHNRFADRRKNGEWFALASVDVAHSSDASLCE